MNELIRCITEDGSLAVTALDSSDMVFTAQSLHNLTKTTSAAFGRLLTAASMMGVSLKSGKSNLTVKIKGNGEIGNMVVRADSSGNVRGYVDHPEIDYPIRDDNKIDVGRAVGNIGQLAVIRDEGAGEPYIGHVELVSGEIAEDITAYYAYSEQIPTVCALGVLVDKETHKVMLAGGLLIQALPGADNNVLDKLEKNISKLDSVTALLAQGLKPLDICKRALEGFELQILDKLDVNYVCNCSKERFAELLMTIGKEEIMDLPLVKDDKAQIICQYCNKHYYYDKKELSDIAEKIK